MEEPHSLLDVVELLFAMAMVVSRRVGRQGESAQRGGAVELIFLTRSVVRLIPVHERMCLRRRTLRRASWHSSCGHWALASKAEKVLATARCRKARHLVVGPPPGCGRPTARGANNHREAVMKLYNLDRADGLLSRGSLTALVEAVWGASPVPHVEDDP